MPPIYKLEAFKAALSLGVAIISLLITWQIGNRLTNRWNIRQKRRELNLEAVHVLHDIYGEFKEVLKLWRLMKRPLERPVVPPADERWVLLTRACALESKTEALVLRLAAERALKRPHDTEDIGLFRQAMQTLRECIRDDVDCPLGSRREEYRLLNRLAPKVAAIVGRDPLDGEPSAEVAQSQLADIVAVTSHSWAAKVASLKESGKIAPLADEGQDT